MCLAEGNLRNLIITESQAQFPLQGMVAPTFQNQGTANVYVDGCLLLPGQSYAVNVPTIVLKNNISIQFEKNPAKTKILYIGFVSKDND